MLITDNGTLVRTRVNEVSIIGRNTQGVRIIRTSDTELVVALQRIDEIQSDDIEGELDSENSDETTSNVLPEIESTANDEPSSEVENDTE